MTIEEILTKYPLPKHLVVEFAYTRAMDVVDSNTPTEAKYALSLVKRWLDGDATVTAKMLMDAANAAHYAAYSAAYSAAYAADSAADSAAYAAYSAAYAAYSAHYAAYSAAYAAYSAHYAADSAVAYDAKMEEYRLLLLQTINTKLSKFERMLLGIPENLRCAP